MVSRVTESETHWNTTSSAIYFMFTRCLWMTCPNDADCELPTNTRRSPSSCSPVCRKLPVNRKSMSSSKHEPGQSGSLKTLYWALTFFQMGILAFSWLMQCWIACWPSCRCGDEIAMTTLAWPTSTHLKTEVHLLTWCQQFIADLMNTFLCCCCLSELFLVTLHPSVTISAVHCGRILGISPQRTILDWVVE